MEKNDSLLRLQDDLKDDDDDRISVASSEEPPLEPRFKYERMDGTAALNLYKTELFSAVDVHYKFIALGTQSGKIYVIDHQGYADFQNVPVLKPHRCPVSKIKIDETGSYILSAANDGKIEISGIGSKQLCCSVNVKVMPRSIAIAPDFAKPNSGNCFVMGERSLMMYEKKVFKISHKITTVYSGSERDGFINCCSWEGNFIAFTNDAGTQIVDRYTLESVTFIPPIHDVDRVRSSRSPPRHAWLPDESLVIGWADTVTIVKIGNTPSGRRGEIHYKWHVPVFISGISYMVNPSIDTHEIFISGLCINGEEMDDDGMSVMSSSTTLTAMESSVVPVLKTLVIRALSLNDYELQSEDTLDSVHIKNALPCNVHMAGIPSLNAYFLISLKDIIVVVPYGPNDGVRWRLKYHLWDQAWDMAKLHAKELESTDIDIRMVGRKVIEGFMRSDRPKAAAARLPQVCGESKEEWEWAVSMFETARLCTLLADVLPTSNPQLEPENYECVIQAALFNDTKLFRRLIKLWKPDLYRTGYIINRTQWRIREIAPDGVYTCDDEKILLEGLAHLYLYERKYENALKIYISCRDTQIFNVIDKHQLFDLVKDQISELMAINSDRALRLLLDNEDSVPASFVMDKIARQPKLQMAYLTKLMSRNEGSEYADKAVQLYAEYDRSKLLPFLRRNENYHLNRALNICKSKNYVDEMIYLLTRGGNHFDAVQLMVKSYDSIDKAIEYCKGQDDSDLWLHMLEVVSETPEHLAKLLVEASSCLNPLVIIDKMPLNTEIPGIQDSLLKVLAEADNQLKIQHGCYESMVVDSQDLLAQFCQNANRSVYVSSEAKCSVCLMEVNEHITDAARRPSSYRLYGCGHVIHVECFNKAERRMAGVGNDGDCLACSERPLE